MRKEIWIILLGLIFSTLLQAQAVFISKGKIEYEKKVNMHKWLEDNSWMREMKDRMPVYRTTYFDLLFDSTSSVFKAGKEVPDDKWKNFWGQSGTEENITHMNYNEGIYTALKQVFEKKFIIQDSLLPIEWRITDEVRTIAGFDCRKAVGRMYDSLYVIAFYTDQIPLQAGPEQYNGLPGTILGLAFPRYYTTWFATKVELVTPKPTELKAPASKGSAINRQELMSQVKKVYEWGTEEEKQKYFWNMVL
jgi:GLPGLI family protein